MDMNDICNSGSNNMNRRQAGFSMLEMLIGVAIGLIALVTIFQMLVSSETRKRTTASGSDAQISGVQGLFNLERDVRLSGMGFGTAPANIMGCQVTVTFANTLVTPTPRLFPIQIVQGASGAPDEIVTFYGGSTFLTSLQPYNSATATTKKTEMRNGFMAGDKVIVSGNETTAAGSANCALVEITDTANADGFTFEHTASSSYTNFYTQASAASEFNTAAGTGSVFIAGSLFNLGVRPQRNRWQIQGGKTLVSTDTLRNGAPVEVAEGIVDMQAEYGVDSNDDGRITSASPNEWVIATPSDWTKVRAIRVALLARSRQYEIAQVTTTARAWQGGNFTMRNLDGTDGASAPAQPQDDWRNYRYNVYEKVIPLRNMIWGTAP
jgi:type IV pilus assembly protein PilW